MKMDNGVHACYEGNSSAAGITNCWNSEYYRLEFEEGTVEISGGNQIKIYRVGQETEIYEAPSIERLAHGYLFDEFIGWLDGGKPSATQISDNIKSFIMVIAAMETTDDGSPKQMAEYLKDL